MLLERKAFSMRELDTSLPCCFSGCVFFLCLGIFYMFRPNMSFVAPVQEKVVVGLFFLGAILCLSFSWLFHTVYCHSEGVSRLFSKWVPREQGRPNRKQVGKQGWDLCLEPQCGSCSFHDCMYFGTELSRDLMQLLLIIVFFSMSFCAVIWVLKLHHFLLFGRHMLASCCCKMPWA